MPDHPLLHAGAGRFWRPPKERSSSTSNVGPSGRYQEIRSAGNDTASETFDPLLSKEMGSPRHSFSQSVQPDDPERPGRTPSIASGSSGASGNGPYGAYGLSALSLPAASSVSLQSSAFGLDRTSTQAYRILSDERKGKLASHIRQLQQQEELRVTQERRDGGAASEQKPLDAARSYTNIRAAAQPQHGRKSSDAASARRPSTDASANRQSLGQELRTLDDLKRMSPSVRSSASGESLPAALKLPTSAGQPHYSMRPSSGPSLHLETSPKELDPGNGTVSKDESASSPRPSVNSSRIEMNALKSPTELHGEEAAWAREPRLYEMPTTRPTIKRKPMSSTKRAPLADTDRPRSANTISELPTRMQLSPSAAVSPVSGRSSEELSQRSGPSGPTSPKKERPERPERPVSAVPDPEVFRPSNSAQLLNLIPPTLPRRTTPTPLPAANTFELSSSLSVVHRPRAKSDDKRPPRRTVSPSKLALYNTVPGAPFPLLPREEEAKDGKEEEAKAKDGEGAAAAEAEVAPTQDPLSPEKHHRRLDIEQYLGDEAAGPPISIEPDIDPRTGRRWVGSLSSASTPMMH